MEFTGEYIHTLDPKGRLIIPTRFREQLGSEFYVTRGLDGCLFVYPEDEWKAFSAKLRSLPLIDEGARKLTRFFAAGATPCELDKQGRILVPATLREFACLEKDVVLAGMVNRIEIWSKDRWISNNTFDNEDIQNVAAHLTSIGFVL
ncbi:MAG: division/cell wall cluster transcriptional repressor MraZ [Lachnospiraceae bacterium]|jgi:MraZ protein|nr:division/cell wall cluster transcriptional repressor MraZ [Lachnospiraceae bacterium]